MDSQHSQESQYVTFEMQNEGKEPMVNTAIGNGKKKSAYSNRYVFITILFNPACW